MKKKLKTVVSVYFVEIGIFTAGYTKKNYYNCCCPDDGDNANRCEDGSKIGEPTGSR